MVLPLRHWIERQIDNSTYSGLTWEEKGEETKIFRLPWVVAGESDWQEHHKILSGWAEHVSRRKCDHLEDSILKVNFLQGMQKSHDFEEMDRKEDGYRVYKILNYVEARERKNRRIKSRIKRGCKPKVDRKTACDTRKVASLLANIDFQRLMSSRPNCVKMKVRLLSDMKSTPADTDTVYVPCEIHATVSISDTGDGEQTRTITIKNIRGAESAAVEEKGDVDTARDGEDSCESSSDFDFRLNPVIEQLAIFGLNPDCLRKCQIYVAYNRTYVLQRHVDDLHRGYRINFGDTVDQIHRLTQQGVPMDGLDDLRLSEIKLPVANSSGRRINTILENFDCGIVLLYDPDNFELHVKRLCQIPVFIFNPHDDSPESEPVELKRNRSVAIFSVEKYLIQCVQISIRDGERTHADLDLVIAVGSRPRSKRRMSSHMKGLKIKIKPYLPEHFKKSYHCVVCEEAGATTEPIKFCRQSLDRGRRHCTS